MAVNNCEGAQENSEKIAIQNNSERGEQLINLKARRLLTCVSGGARL